MKKLFKTLSIISLSLFITVSAHARFGGDDVGNGGDSIREAFISYGVDSLKQIEEELTSSFVLNKKEINISQLRSVLDISVIKVERGIDNIPARVVNGMILLNRQIWTKFIDTGKDVRNLIIHLILKINKIEDPKMNISGYLYSYLNKHQPYGVTGAADMTPYCDISQVLHETVRITSVFSGKSKKSIKDAAEDAMRKCTQNKKLKCVAKKQGNVFNILTGKTFYAIVEGITYKTVSKSEDKLQEELCLSLKSCEELYDIAPWGQIKHKDFLKLERKIEKECQ